MINHIRSLRSDERALVGFCVVALAVTLFTLPVLFTGPLAAAATAWRLARHITTARRRARD